MDIGRNMAGPPSDGRHAEGFFFEEAFADVGVKTRAVAMVRGKENEGVLRIGRSAQRVHDTADFRIDHFDHAMILIDIILPIPSGPIAYSSLSVFCIGVVEIVRQGGQIACNRRCKSVLTRAPVWHRREATVVRIEKADI